MFFTTVEEFKKFVRSIKCLICGVNEIKNILTQNDLTTSTSTTTTTTTIGGEESRITEDNESRLMENNELRIIE